MTAEEQLREHAKTLGISMNALKSLVNQVYIDDENLTKRKINSQQAMLQQKQNMALDLQISVDAIDLELKRGKLIRAKNRIEKWNKIKSIFTKKTKS